MYRKLRVKAQGGKKMKKRFLKVISIFLILTLCFAVMSPAASAASTTPAELAHLKCGVGGSFRILQIADIQDGAKLRGITADFIRAAIEKTEPNLIVLTGDNIAGYGCKSYIKPIDKLLVKSAINGFMSIFEEAGIPVAAVFGNHDDEGTKISKEEQFEIYSQYSCFIGYDEGDSVSGCGNYNVPIYSSDGDRLIYNLWMFDSGTYDEVNGGYDYIKQDQLDWYVSKSNELKAENGGVPVPSMSFQHIIVPEIYQALKQVPEGTEGAVCRDGVYYVLDSENTRCGAMHESPCPSNTNSGQFQAIKNQADIVAIFFWHDHVNTFEVNYQDIDLVATPGAGFASYGDELRGVRLITINENDTSTYETEVITYHSLYGDDLMASLRFDMMANETNIWTKIWSGIVYYTLRAFYSFAS
jgi:predicted phosphodiesterase